MATAGDERVPYESRGAKEKSCKRSFLQDINEETENVVSQEAGQNNSIGVSDEGGSSASIFAVTGILELEQFLKQKTFTRSETQRLTALLHSRTCDDIFVERDGPKPPLRLLTLEASTTIGSLENLPSDLLLNILTRLLAKQIAQMRCVSKYWNALLSESSFVKSHFHHSIHNNDRILLVFDNWASSSNPKPFTALPCSSPHPELPNFIKPPPLISTSGDIDSIFRVIGSVHGLICSSYDDDSLIHIWNPSLSVVSTLPPHYIPSRGCYEIYFRFGFDPKTDDYKLVKVIGVTESRKGRSNFVKEWLQVEVYSMRKGSWGFINQRFPSCVTRVYDYEDVCVYGLDGHLHWVGDIDEEGEVQTIVAFDLGSETFREMSLPDAILAHNDSNPVGVLEGKLCFMSWVVADGVCEVWVMEEYGVAESWVKRHVVSRFIGRDVGSFGFTSRNEFLVEDEDCRLVLYDPVADKAKIVEKYCRGRFGVGKVVEYVDSLVWVAPTLR